ncbi:restriction endonuclease subunit S [Catenibacterium mitsuokai]|uniref:restriction endonuclease subunit S n=1 Tax=Catenibacterium mitsuokai TaxID=100886 RepID=UPI001C390967|nr:restriction endonuclease subunit S [Catenibacterium mitsuokai]MBV3426021.1 restriction endonuclease subunit S [Catenibacterium mitsuokai]
MEKSRKPKIRFKGYNDDWEQRKFRDIGSVSMCRRIFKEQTSLSGDVPFYKIGTFGAEPDAFISKKLFEEYKLKYPYPNKGDILISASGSIGKIVEYTGKNEYFQDSNIVWLKHEDYIKNSFLKCYYSIVKWSGIEGSTIKRLYNENILNTSISVPSEMEQEQLGVFFENIELLITLHQRKLDKLINVKKSMLEKMFPKQGSIVPEIRFNGFTQAWEQRKLEDLLESVQIKNSDGHYSQDDILACSLGTELNKKTIFYGLRSTKESVKSYRIVNINDVIYTKSPIKGYPNGIVRTSKIVDGIVPSLYCVYQKKRDISMAIDTRFIQSYLEDKNRLDYYLFPLVNVGARNNVNITDKEFLKGIIKIPICIEEQIQIVEMLEKVNHLITLHQRLNASYLGI